MADSTRTMLRESRHCPAYSEIFPTGLLDSGQLIGDRTQRKTGQVRWFGQNLSEVPDSGIGYTQDHRTNRTDEVLGELDTYQPTTLQPMGRKRRAGDRLDTRPNVDREVGRAGTVGRYGKSDGHLAMVKGSRTVILR